MSVAFRTPSPNRHQRETLRDSIVVASFVGDLVVATLSLISAYGLRFVWPLAQVGVPHPGMTLSQYAPHIYLGVALILVLMGNGRLYAPAYLHSVRRHWRIIGQSCALWIVGYLTLSVLFSLHPAISRLYCLIGCVLLAVMLMLWRKLLHVWLRRDSVSGRIKQKVLFFGWSEESNRLVRAVKNEPAHIYEVVGMVPDRDLPPGAQPPPDMPRLGGYDDVERLIQEYEIDLVLLTDLGLPRERLVSIGLACEREMVEFKLIPNMFQVFVSGLHLENFSGIPVLGVSRLPLHSLLNVQLKRAVDVVGGCVGLLFGLPVMSLFGLAIKLEDGGPVFYRQRRLGRNGQVFTIYKLRSMRLDAERGGRPGWTVRDDPRCLRVGAFMRRWNIDEIPQFWNVLRGEMSLVGPRPERPELIESFKHQILHYNARHNIKPGITGWAQINGLRGDTDLTQRLKADLYYIEHWNLWLDFQIMVMTFFKRPGAC
ncbi:MAG: exopolysaccharide biosynthesis polyprenyl glycosylphosphotransferase [Verrucomicrobiales bacterium]